MNLPLIQNSNVDHNLKAPPPSSPPTGGRALYLAMIYFTKSMMSLECSEPSMSDLASALYQTSVGNGLKKLEAEQHDLGLETFVTENWSELSKYWSGQGGTINWPPGTTDADKEAMEAFWKKCGGADTDKAKDAANAVVQAQTQTIGSQNTYIQQAKAIPDSMLSAVKSLVAAQSQVSSMFGGLVSLIRILMQHSWK